jgi:hypothetical protein
MENNKDVILDSFRFRLTQLSQHHYKNREIMKKMMLLSFKLKEECQEPEIEIFQKFLSEMIQTKKMYEDYLKRLVMYYEDFFKTFKNGRKFIKELFEYSDCEEINILPAANRLIKVKSNL